MKVEAEKLNELVSLAVNGIGKKGLNALNTAITLFNDGGKLALITTTGVATLKIATDIDSSNFTSCSVESTLFQQLLTKLTGELELSIVDGRYLFIKGTGEYKIALIFDYNGNLALIPDVKRVPNEGLTDINIEELSRAINVCKNACPEDLNVPIFYNIYFGEKVIATNDEKLIVVPNLSRFKGLISVHNLGIITSVFKGDTYYKIDGKELIMQDSRAVLVTIADNFDEYPATVADGIELTNKFEVDYQELMNVIEKGRLFITLYERNKIKLDIESDGLVLRTSENFYEKVAYISPNQVEPKEGLIISLLDLYSVLSGCANGPVTLSCDGEGPVIINQADYTGVVSLYDE